MSENRKIKFTTNKGVFVAEMFEDKAPLTTKNFIELVEKGFYDGIIFHRVIDGFMIQGGDPTGTGYTIPAEFVPEYKHAKGALAAARRGDAANPAKESSGSQFYIVQDENTCAQLDGEYTVFGQTVEGFDVIDAIAKVDTDRRDRPVSDVKILSITLDEASKPAPAAAADSTEVK